MNPIEVYCTTCGLIRLVGASMREWPRCCDNDMTRKTRDSVQSTIRVYPGQSIVMAGGPTVKPKADAVTLIAKPGDAYSLEMEYSPEGCPVATVRKNLRTGEVSRVPWVPIANVMDAMADMHAIRAAVMGEEREWNDNARDYDL